MSESVSACGWACTADSTASRGRVTRRAVPAQHLLELRRRRHPSTLAQFLERIKTSWALSQAETAGRRSAHGAACSSAAATRTSTSSRP